MNILAYLVTVANLQNMSKFNNNLKDITFNIDSLYELTKVLKNMPDFPLDGYRENGFQRHGNMGVYASDKLRDYIYGRSGKHDDEGIIMKLHYSNDQGLVNNYDTISYIIHGNEMNDHAKKEINKYVVEISGGRRNKRLFLDKLGP